MAGQAEIKRSQIAHLVAKIDYDFNFEVAVLQSGNETPEIIRRAFKIFRRKDDIAVGFIDLGEEIINGAKARFKAAIAAQFPRNVVMAGKGTGDAGFWIEKPMLRQVRAIIIQLYLDCGSAGLVGADMKKAFAHGPPVGDGPWWCTHGGR